MSPALANFLFEAANFLLLMAGLGWVLFKPVRRALDAERERHDCELEQSQHVRSEAEALASEARAAKAAAAREVEEQWRERLEAARREAAEIVESARKAQLDAQRRFEQELAVRREAESFALAEAVGRIAAESLRSLLRSVDGPALDVALVRAARAQLDTVPLDARRAAVVESARPLDAESQAILERALGNGFTRRVVDELGAGVRVITPVGQVDATAVSLARRAANALKSDLHAAPSGLGASDA